MNITHRPVLLAEAVTSVLGETTSSEQQSITIIDGTFGRGGHSKKILDQLGENGRLIAFDRDMAAIQSSLDIQDPRFTMVHSHFSGMQSALKELNIFKVDGILLDLGISSPQIDEAERGFSFMQDGPLDMRMDQTRGQSAADWVNSADEDEITWVLKEFGEERFAKRMARAIIAERQKQPFTRTKHLAEVIKEANPAWEKGKHPATRAFQAIRIHVNNELGDLESVLDQALAVLAPGGRLVVISFHSLEDRVVKRFIRRQELGDPVPKGLPIRDDQLNKRMRSLGKAIKASDAEVSANVRSRSAVMRVAEKL